MSKTSIDDDMPDITIDSIALNLGCDEITISAWSTDDNISVSLSLDTKSSFGKSIKKARSIVPIHTANIKRSAYHRKDSNETVKYHSLPEIMQTVKDEFETGDESEQRCQIRPFIYLITFISFTLLCFLGMSTVTLQLPTMNITKNTIDSTAQRMTSTLEQYNLLMENIEQNKREIDMLQKNDVLTYNRQLRTTNDISKTNEHIKTELLPHLQKTYRLNQRKIQAMIDLIQRDSYRDTFEKYGNGPHSIELILRHNDSQDKQSIFVDLESIDVMPHTIHLFLEQVYHNLWKGAILRNSEQLGDQGSQTDLKADQKLDEFESLGLSSLHFIEENKIPLQNESDSSFLCYLNNGPDLQLAKDPKKITGPCFGKLSVENDLQKLFSDTAASTLIIEIARIVNLQMHAGLSYCSCSARHEG
ncbi:hypothetical protein CTEN210_18298 [Chaetoceros tenuissimus]|uniref:Uncharacterized protein n=1 Tax=Chaetoceros tenuissimus TaxID=426638 RepID=A0AAD3DD75_9STRA|nr:hypothetical protein CTEN210_18298 [Chaetoceros tenuissimus]